MAAGQRTRTLEDIITQIDDEVLPNGQVETAPDCRYCESSTAVRRPAWRRTVEGW